MNNKVFRVRFDEIQEMYPLKETAWKSEWSSSYFDRHIIFVLCVEKDISELQLLERFEKGMSLQNSLEGDMTECMSDCEEEEELGEESGKRARISPLPHKLVAFCQTRWYSAFMVMDVIYSLRDAVQELSLECEKGLGGKKGKKLYDRIQDVDWPYLERLLHYLRPLVLAIDFCQSDGTTMLDVKEMWDNIYLFYVNNTGELSEGVGTRIKGIIALKKGSVEKMFKKRRDLFEIDYPMLRSLFSNDYTKIINGEDYCKNCKQVQDYAKTVYQDLLKYYECSNLNDKYFNANCCQTEVFLFIEKTYERVGISTMEYLERNSYDFGRLKGIYEDLMCRPASSAAVERSFSVQGLFMNQRRSRMSDDMIRNLMMIRANYFFAERNDWESNLLDYIERNSMVEKK